MTHASRRALALTALVVSAGLIITACTSTASAKAGSSSTSTTHVTKYTSATSLLKAAKAEGSLTVYISNDYSYEVSGFKAKYPWAKLNVTNGGSSDLAQKWLTEAQSGISNVDIGFIQPLASLQLQQMNALADVQVPNDAYVPAGLKGSPYAHSVNQQPIVIGYNTKTVTDPPESLADLANPKWKGKLVLDDPALDSITAWVLASARQKWGDTKWKKWINGITANDPIFTNNDGDSYTDVLQGTREVCMCTYGDFQAQAPGTPMKPVFFTDPNGSLEYSIVGSISSRAPHPAMAALFLNYVLDPNGGQKAFADNHRIPAVKVANSPTTLPKGVRTSNVIPLIQRFIDQPDSYTQAWSKMEPK